MNMHVYIYDDFLDKPKYRRALNRIETRITDLGLSGKIIRLSVIKNIKEAITGEIRRGAKTIVIVGNNLSLNKIINSIVSPKERLEDRVVFAIIPVGANNEIAKALGMNNEEDACNTILARRIKKLDLGIANKTYFLAEAEIENKGTNVDIKKNYTISSHDNGRIYIINLLTLSNFINYAKVNPADGKLDLYIDGRGNNRGYFSIESVEIKNKEKPVIIDRCLQIACPVAVSPYDNQISLIVGKERSFK
jgi:hypothetical protein